MLDWVSSPMRSKHCSNSQFASPSSFASWTLFSVSVRSPSPGRLGCFWCLLMWRAFSANSNILLRLCSESAWQGSSWRQSSLASSQDPSPWASSPSSSTGSAWSTPSDPRLLGEVLVVAAVFSSFLLPQGLSKDKKVTMWRWCQSLWAGF